MIFLVKVFWIFVVAIIFLAFGYTMLMTWTLKVSVLLKEVVDFYLVRKKQMISELEADMEAEEATDTPSKFHKN